MRTPANLILAGAAGAAAVVLLVAGAGIAYAQTVEPPVLQVDPTAACGRVTLTAKVNQTFGANDTYEIAVFSGANAGGVASTPEGQFLVSANAPAARTFTLPEDAYDGDAFVSWTTVSGPNPEFYVRGVVAVDTDCAPPVEPTVEPTVAPSAPPAPTATADPTTSPAPTSSPADDGPLYATCAEASAAGAAPINVGEPGYMASLDSDDDGVACELPDSSALPVGGAATGG